jgi:hypothetical protein
MPATASGPRHDAAASPSRLPTRRDAPLGGQPGEQRRVFDAGLAPEVHDRELARAQQPGKRLRAHGQPPLCFGEGDQLRRGGEIQGEVLLACGRVCPGAWASGRGSHGQGRTSQAWDVRHREFMHPAHPSGLGRDRGDSMDDLC